MGGYFFGDKKPAIGGKPPQGRSGKIHRLRLASGTEITHGEFYHGSRFIAKGKEKRFQSKWMDG
jgi:hypothetical protein